MTTATKKLLTIFGLISFVLLIIYIFYCDKEGEFYKNFTPNFASDLLSNIFFAIILATLLNNQEKKSQQNQEKFKGISRDIELLNFIIEDTNSYEAKLQRWLEIFNTAEKKKTPQTPISTFLVPRINTELWRIIQKSSNLINILSPATLISLNQFYTNLENAGYFIDLIHQNFQKDNPPGITAIHFAKQIKIDLEKAFESYGNVQVSINIELDRLIKERSNIKTNKSKIVELI